MSGILAKSSGISKCGKGALGSIDTSMRGDRKVSSQKSSAAGLDAALADAKVVVDVQGAEVGSLIGASGSKDRMAMPAELFEKSSEKNAPFFRSGNPCIKVFDDVSQVSRVGVF